MKVQLEEKMYNETTKMSFKVDEALDHFKIFGTNITEQLQKQEKRASKNWVSPELNLNSYIDNIFCGFQKLLEQINNDLQNVSAKAASNELVSHANQVTIAKLQNEAKGHKDDPATEAEHND